MHLWVTAAGVIGPPFVILKGADLSGSTLLDKKQPGFQESDGWSNHLWQKSLTLKLSGKEVTALYKRPYLIDAKTNTVITANAKGWMDFVTMIKWIEVQFAKWVASEAGLPNMLILDNCGSKLVNAVRTSFTEHGITMMALPPNMTDKMQPLDLSVNGPLKAAMRESVRILPKSEDFIPSKSELGLCI